MVKMESEVILGDVTNVLLDSGECELSDIPQRVTLIRINIKKPAFLGYHEEWSEGESRISQDSILCLEGGCLEVLEKIDSMICLVCYIV